MSGIITLYKNSALTQDLSNSSWVQSIILPTTTVPVSGTVTSSGVAGYGLNTGTTTMLDVYIQPTAGTGVHGSDFVSNMQIAPDLRGTPDTYGTLGNNVLVYSGELAPSQSEPTVNTSVDISNPSSGPSLSASSTTSNLAAGTYKVAYSFSNANGETLVSPTTSITITSGQSITVASISLATNATGINYYLTPIAGRSELYLSGNNSGGSSITLSEVTGFFRFWVRQVVSSTDPTGVYQAQLTVSAVDLG